MKYIISLFRNTIAEWLRSNSYTGKNLHAELNCKLIWCQKKKWIYLESLATQGIFANLLTTWVLTLYFYVKLYLI